MPVQRLILVIALLFAVGIVWYIYSSEYVGYMYNLDTASYEYLSSSKRHLTFVSVSADEDMKKSFEKFAQRGVKVIVGPPLSSDGEKIIPYLKKYKMISLSATISSDDLLNSGYIYSLSPSNSDYISSLMEVLKNVGSRNILLVLDPRNVKYSDEFKTILNNYNGQSVYYYNQESLSGFDLSSYDTALLTVSFKYAIDIINQLRKANPEMRIIGTDSLLNSDLITFGGKNSEGMLILYPLEYTEYPEVSLIDECAEILEEHRFISSEQFKRFLNNSVIQVSKEKIFFNSGSVKRDVYLYQISDGQFKMIAKW